MRDSHREPSLHGLGDEAAVAVLRVRFETEKTDDLTGAHQIDQRFEVGLSNSSVKVLLKDSLHYSVLPRSSSGSAVRRGTQPAQVKIPNFRPG